MRASKWTTVRVIAVIPVAFLLARSEPAVAQDETVAQNEFAQESISPDPPPAASQFDYLVGEWQFDATWRTRAGERRGGGTWSARKAFHGWGVIDEWRVEVGGQVVYLGASMRIFDVRRNAWHLVFSDVFNSTWENQHAEFRDGEMHLSWSSWDRQGRRFLMRARYFDISADHFRWEGDRSYDGGETWIDSWLTMDVRHSKEPAAKTGP